VEWHQILVNDVDLARGFWFAGRFMRLGLTVSRMPDALGLLCPHEVVARHE
jgi:hypothetical protein